MGSVLPSFETRRVKLVSRTERGGSGTARGPSRGVSTLTVLGEPHDEEWNRRCYLNASATKGKETTAIKHLRHAGLVFSRGAQYAPSSPRAQGVTGDKQKSFSLVELTFQSGKVSNKQPNELYVLIHRCVYARARTHTIGKREERRRVALPMPFGPQPLPLSNEGSFGPGHCETMRRPICVRTASPVRAFERHSLVKEPHSRQPLTHSRATAPLSGSCERHVLLDGNSHSCSFIVL